MSSAHFAWLSTGSTLSPMILTLRLSNSGLSLRHVAELGRADRREILRMREQHRPGVADPFVKANAAFRGLSLEVRRDIADAQSHGPPPSCDRCPNPAAVLQNLMVPVRLDTRRIKGSTLTSRERGATLGRSAPADDCCPIFGISPALEDRSADPAIAGQAAAVPGQREKRD